MGRTLSGMGIASALVSLVMWLIVFYSLSYRHPTGLYYLLATPQASTTTFIVNVVGLGLAVAALLFDRERIRFFAAFGLMMNWFFTIYVALILHFVGIEPTSIQLYP